MSPHTTTASAPGKIILFGEHAVVYGRPAIAVPVWDVTATATVTDLSVGSGCTIIAHDLDETIHLADAAVDQPLALVVRQTLARLDRPTEPDWRIDLRSDIPVASGLGSGAAVGAALVLALYAHAGQAVDAATVSALVYASETIHHGTPSGIDNTVIAYGQPIWFVKAEEPQRFTAGRAFTIAIADSGIPSPTRKTVGDVRRAWQHDPPHVEALFDAIAGVVAQARAAMAAGDVITLGSLFDRNHALLEELGVGSAPLRRLIGAARTAGAFGAKLSGGGRGGNVIALVEADAAEAVTAALRDAGAKRVITTTLPFP